MFESSLLVDPAEIHPDLVAAMDAVPARAARGGTAAECDRQLRSLLALSRRVEGLLLAQVAAFDDQGFAPALGASSTGSYLAAHGHLDPAAARKMVIAARTADRLPQLGAMLAAGDIGVDHVAAVGFSTRRLPAEVVASEDATFSTLAASGRPCDLRVAGKQLQAMYDVDAVSRDANHVRDSRYLTLAPTFGDAWHLEGQLTPEDGASLAVALESLMAPAGAEDKRTVTQRRADALVELAELGLRSAQLPDCGGDRPRVTLLVQAGRNPFADHRNDLDDDLDRVARAKRGLHDVAGAATGSGVGSPYGQLGLSAGNSAAGDKPAVGDPDGDAFGAGDAPGNTARPGEVQLTVTAFDHGDAQLLASTAMVPTETLARICCEADLNAATLDATGELLNLGRTSRYPNIHQRRATVLRDRHCVFPGCDIPPGRCQVHHLKFWKKHKGRTDLCNLALICWFHHRLVHEDHWTLAKAPPTPQHPAGGWEATAPDGHQLRQFREHAA